MANNQSLSVDRSPTLMENAPNWKESTATESEADVSVCNNFNLVYMYR